MLNVYEATNTETAIDQGDFAKWWNMLTKTNVRVNAVCVRISKPPWRRTNAGLEIATDIRSQKRLTFSVLQLTNSC